MKLRTKLIQNHAKEIADFAFKKGQEKKLDGKEILLAVMIAGDAAKFSMQAANKFI